MILPEINSGPAPAHAAGVDAAETTNDSTQEPGADGCPYEDCRGDVWTLHIINNGFLPDKLEAFPTIEECEKMGAWLAWRGRIRDFSCSAQADGVDAEETTDNSREHQYILHFVPNTATWICGQHPSTSECEAARHEQRQEIDIPTKPYSSLEWCKHDGEQALRAGQIYSYRCTPSGVDAEETTDDSAPFMMEILEHGHWFPLDGRGMTYGSGHGVDNAGYTSKEERLAALHERPGPGGLASLCALQRFGTPTRVITHRRGRSS